MRGPARSANRLLLAAFLLILSACRYTAGEPPRSPDPLPTGQSISVYFTDPESESLRGGPDARLADAIRTAEISVDMAVLELNLWSVRDALLDAQRRGVTVRVVIESDYRDADEVQELLRAGIPVLGDRREGLMHHKFTIIDRKEVWTGSMNYTISDGYRNNNHLVRIQSEALAQNYLVEFNEMFEHDQFGSGSPANTPNPQVDVGGITLSVCFSPDDGCSRLLADRLRAARESIHFMAFSFTSDALGDVLIERSRAGVSVAGVMEATQVRSNSGTEFERLRAAGINVRRDGNPRNMHHKVLIIDGRFVAIGSYNFSYFAETRNDENLVIIEDTATAARFEAEFQKLIAQAER